MATQYILFSWVHISLSITLVLDIAWQVEDEWMQQSQIL